MTEPVFVGALSEDTETEIALSVVNTPVYTMPATGGKGFPGLIISVVLLGTSLFLTCCIRKKEN